MCSGDTSDPAHVQIMFLVVSQANDTEGITCLSPLFDSMNHAQEGQWNTKTYSSAGVLSDLIVSVIDTIAIGQQVYNSFGHDAASVGNRCHWL